MEKKIICQINSCIPGTRGCVDVLKQWNYIWSSSCSWSHRLVKLTVIHYYSPRSICLQSVQFSRLVVSDSLRPHRLQHARLPCPSPAPGACSNSCPSNPLCHPTISSSVVPVSSHPQSLPASGSFQMSQLFASGGQIGVSASTSIFSSIRVFSNNSALHIRWPRTLLPSKIFLPLHTSRPSTLYMSRCMNREDI